MKINTVILGNSAGILKKDFLDQSVDLIYADPPFGTQADQVNTERQSSRKLEYSDKWATKEDYLNYLRPILLECKRVLKETGAIFLHCDWRMSHHIRVLMDDIFGEKFQK
jgi:site-specific DNA-methyltransferase (adenine-specific)